MLYTIRMRKIRTFQKIYFLRNLLKFKTFFPTFWVKYTIRKIKMRRWRWWRNKNFKVKIRFFRREKPPSWGWSRPQALLARKWGKWRWKCIVHLSEVYSEWLCLGCCSLGKPELRKQRNTGSNATSATLQHTEKLPKNRNCSKNRLEYEFEVEMLLKWVYDEKFRKKWKVENFKNFFFQLFELSIPFER